jgi:hypothetical protein
MAAAEWLSALDSYLYSLGKIGLEDVLAEGCISGRVPIVFAGNITIERELIHRALEDDGGICEGYRGSLSVDGARYQFECRLFIDSDGTHFVSDIARLEPVEWHAGIRVA